jgi:orotidine 5'-phosphate decarboxylase subfamily 2
MGAEGFSALQAVIACVPGEIPVILDVKRGDIGSSSQAYAKAAFDVLGADAVTLNAYLGQDALEPFLDVESRAGFVLTKTSNPGADELQRLIVDGDPFYVQLARRVAGWRRAGQLGLVVGATDPRAVAQVRRVAPHAWLLCPGVGAQSGDAAGRPATGWIGRADRRIAQPGAGPVAGAGSPASPAADQRGAGPSNG